MKPCRACGRDGDLLQVTSAINAQSFDVCVTCFEHQAEPVSVVIRAVNSVGWKEIPKTIRRAVRVFDLGDYVTVKTWAERMSHRQLVLVRPDPIEQEEDDELAVILEMQRRATEPLRVPRQRRRNWVWMLLAFFGLCREIPA